MVRFHLPAPITSCQLPEPGISPDAENARGFNAFVQRNPLGKIAGSLYLACVLVFPSNNMGKTMKGFTTVAVMILLCGCAVGTRPNKENLSDSYVVPLSYQDTYRRVYEHARRCMPNATITGNLFTGNKTSVVRIALAEIGDGEQMSTRVEHVADDQTRVIVTVSDVGHFDERQMLSVRKSIKRGSPQCRY